MSSFFKKITTATLTIILVFSITITSVNAQVIYVPTNDMGPFAIKRTTDTTMLQVKNYVLDGLAWSVAKIMLQQVTASVVNWINSGFEGSPAFLTNPGAFFADTADQITGAFIANTGVLSRLCSPFSIDIRLGLALSGGGSDYRRYECTLSTVINNAKKSTVNVNGNVTVNGSSVINENVSASGDGASIDGFMNGDFNQGGWPAFMAMTTQPQNNIYGAYLQAKSDLDYQIATKQNNIRLDLQMGRGFMSWQKCTDVNIDEAAMFSNNSKDAGLTQKVGKDGKVKYQDCQTQTPGSVIAGSIDKSLGIPQDTLNIAGSLDQIVGALFSQLVSKVLSGGLHASSNYSSQGSATAGVATQLLQQQTGDQLSDSRNRLQSSLTSYSGTALQYSDLRQKAVDSLNTAKLTYQTAIACFQGKLPTGSISTGTQDADYMFLQSQISNANAAIAKVDIAIAQYTAKVAEAYSRTERIRDLQKQIANAMTTDEINKASSDYNTAIQSGLGGELISETDIANATTDLEAAKSQASLFTQNAMQFQSACNSFRPGTAGQTGSGFRTGL
ncbi:MAG: hypothetical protein WCV79_00465 [Candidatus Paceibacterota bacterium]